MANHGNATKKKLIDWNEIESLVNILTNKIKELDFQFNGISTVGRGGLVPARLFADRFDIKTILVDKDIIQADSLFVDDIYDSSDTFKKVFPRVKNKDKLVYVALIARKGKKLPKQLIYGRLTRGNEYIVFPWDRFEHGLAHV